MRRTEQKKNGYILRSFVLEWGLKKNIHTRTQTFGMFCHFISLYISEKISAAMSHPIFFQKSEKERHGFSHDDEEYMGKTSKY